MGKRYLDCTASEIRRMNGKELADAIAGSEGRLLVCETIGAVRPMLGDVTNAEFAAAMGADLIILNLFDVHAPVIQGLPDTAPGTVPGITTEYIRRLVSCAHELGKLTLTAIGTSQEGADTATIREIALMCKMTGTDLHHLGDSGYLGMALPENILEYGKVIRGVRHTYRQMAKSVNR